MTSPAVLEAAWQSFLSADVPVATVLAFEEAVVDPDQLARLQRVIRDGRPAEQGAAAVALRALLAGAGVRNALALDGLVAAGLDGAEAWADALAVRLDALGVAARWHLIEAGRLVGNIGHDLLRLLRLDEARSWYERALAWDPTNPFVVLGLAEVHLARGELPHAFAYRDHLDTAGYPAAHSRDFDAEVARRGLTRPAPGAGYLPDLGSLFALDEVGFARQCTAFQFDRNAMAKETLRAHALACLMRGRAEHAYWVASLSAAAGWDGDEARGGVEISWSHAVVRAMTVRLGPASIPAQVEARVGTLFSSVDVPHDDDEAAAMRLATVDELARRGDLSTLGCVLHDPHPGLRLAAAAALVAAGDARARNFIDELATYERARGFATWRPEMAPTASRLRWFAERRAVLAGKPPLLIPEDGIENPSLGAFEPGQVISMMLTFVEPLDEPTFTRIEVTASAVLARVSWDRLGGEPQLVVERDEVTLHLALVKRGSKRGGGGGGKSGDLRPMLRDLLAAIAGVLPFAEIMLTRLDLPADGGHFLQPVDDPRDLGTHDHDDVWEPSFDPAAVPPASEPEGGLFMLFPTPDGQLPERRNARLWLRDLRIVYGLPDIEHRAADERATEVERAVASAFHHAFRGLPPRFRNRHDRANGVDPIVKDGRRGYAIAVDGMDPRFLVHYPGTSRFREYELFQAMRELCGAVGLRPIVHWYREGGLYIVNCWEW